MITPFVSRERIPLSGTFKQKFLDVNGNEFFWDIQIKKKIGEGRSCLCYDVEVEKGPQNHQRMILKQFYPDPGEHEISVSLDGTKLTIDFLEERPDVQELAKKFEDAFMLQNRLAGDVDQVVKPSVNYFDGATKLVLYEVNSGESLDHFIEENPKGLPEMLEAIAETAEALSAIHQAGFIYMDMKPENILWNHKRVKLFDFDAAISLKEKSPVYSISHDGRVERAQTLAPELRQKGDKRPLLTVRADIYSLGCMLFEYIMGRCPSDAECFEPEVWKDAFHDQMFDTYEDMFGFEIQEEIYEILCKSMNFDMVMRYKNASDMALHIRKVCAKLLTAKKKTTKQADNNLLSGYVLDEYPVFKYKYRKNGRFCMDVCIMGDALIRDAFFKNIFACAQMEGVDLNIRIVSSDAKDYMENMLMECPQLLDTTYIYLNSDSQRYNETPLNQAITKEPFANIYFYETEEYLSAVPEDARYFLIVCKNISKNKELAKELTLLFEEEKGKRIFIGYGKRGNGGCSVSTELKASGKHIRMQAFCCDANTTKQEKMFRTNIFKKALGVHTYYTKEWNPKAEKQEIKEDLYSKDETGNYYNLKSSLRCALSVKYKFDACNIPQNQDNAKVFYERVLDSDVESAKELYDRIVYLEHRSWMCFMITEGYQRPAEKELEKYFFRDGHDHRNKRKKLHPCISASEFTAPKKLRNLALEEWENEALLEDMDFDEHDRMSLRLHILADKRVKKMNWEATFSMLEEYIEVLDDEEDLKKLKDELYQLTLDVAVGKEKKDRLWRKAYQTLNDEFAKQDAEDACMFMKKINADMKVVKERNLYHDYFLNNASIIQAIPRLVMKETDLYHRIYKTPTLSIEELTYATCKLEPKELVLLDGEAFVDDVRRFLCENGQSDVKVSTCTLEEIVFSAKGKKMVLDITGSTPGYMMKLFAKGLVEKMPVIRHEQGKLVPECQAEDVRYY